MKNFRAAVSAMLSILSGFHLNHGLVSSFINYCRKTILTGIPFIFYQAHDAGFVPAGNAGLILHILSIQPVSYFQQGHTVLVLAENTI